MIRYELKNGVAVLHLEAAPLNILGIEMLETLNRMLDEISADPKVQVVLLRSSIAKVFSAGAAVGDHMPDKVNKMLTAFHRVVRTLDRWNKVSVAEVDGICLGGGAELAFACDLVVASERTEFGFPEIDLGCFPPVAAASLANRIGWHFAADYVLTGRRFKANEAMQRGLVNRVVTEAELSKAAWDYAEALTQKSASVLRLTRRALRESREVPFAQALWACEEMFREQLIRSEDYNEGLQAFLEKRPARWSGR